MHTPPRPTMLDMRSSSSGVRPTPDDVNFPCIEPIKDPVSNNIINGFIMIGSLLVKTYFILYIITFRGLFILIFLLNLVTFNYDSWIDGIISNYIPVV